MTTDKVLVIVLSIATFVGGFSIGISAGRDEEKAKKGAIIDIKRVVVVCPQNEHVFIADLTNYHTDTLAEIRQWCDLKALPPAR